METMTIIKTKDFILRPIRMSDAEEYWEVMQDKDTITNFTTVPNSLIEAQKEIKDMIKDAKEKDSHTFTIVSGGTYAGNVVLQHQNYDKTINEGRIHVWIHPLFRGKGLATKALISIIHYGFKKKKFKKIYAQCKTINKGMIKIMQKLRFKKVQTLITKPDQWHKGGIQKILWVLEKQENES